MQFFQQEADEKSYLLFLHIAIYRQLKPIGAPPFADFSPNGVFLNILYTKWFIRKRYDIQKIRDLREDSDLSQTEIAKAIHMHKTTYVRYESGEREIPLNIAILLCKYCSVSLDYLAGLSEEKN